MTYSTRTYQSPSDLDAVGDLVRAAYRKAPFWNAWSFARFDIWAQRRLADEQVHGQTGWQNRLSFWRDTAGVLRGAAALDRGSLGFVITDPGEPGLLDPMLDWLEGCYQSQGSPERPLMVEALERSEPLNRCLAGRGFHLQADWMNIRHKPLDLRRHDPVVLPAGYTIRPVETRDDLLAHVQAVSVVFHMLDPEEVYRVVAWARSYRPELNLLVLDPAGETAAFATLWFDPALSKAEFEPVGTLPAYQKLGLGLAVLSEGCNRLRSLGCATVGVDSWSESPAANRLYEKAGLVTQDRLLGWERSF